MTEIQYRHAIYPDLPFGALPDRAEDWQWEQIQFLFGIVALRAQSYEDGLARFVVAAERRWNRSGKLESEINQMTLWNLQQEYKHYCRLEPHDIARMDMARELRNSLAHNFFRRRMRLLATTEGRDEVINELNQADTTFRMERDDVYWNLSLVAGETLV